MNDYDLLRDYLKQQTLPEFVLSFDKIEEIIDASLPRAAHRASWWETLRSPQEKMPQREACLAGGYIAIVTLAFGEIIGVVAVNGQMVWADIFASTNLLEKYWPKLVRSYAAEAYIARTATFAKPDTRAAQAVAKDAGG